MGARPWSAGSIFFGGGTPSLVPPEMIEEMIALIGNLLPVSQSTEITLEANPGTVSTKGLCAFRKSGINRLSLGIQSLRNTELRFLGRLHDAHTARRAVDCVREAGFENYSVDLIYGLPGQALRDWEESLEGALEFSTPHVSAYELTLEPGTTDGGEPVGRRNPGVIYGLGNLVENAVRFGAEVTIRRDMSIMKSPTTPGRDFGADTTSMIGPAANASVSGRAPIPTSMGCGSETSGGRRIIGLRSSNKDTLWKKAIVCPPDRRPEKRSCSGCGSRRESTWPPWGNEPGRGPWRISPAPSGRWWTTADSFRKEAVFGCPIPEGFWQTPWRKNSLGWGRERFAPGAPLSYHK